MSQDIDFLEPTIKKIQRPKSIIKNLDKRPTESKSFEIKKTWGPEKVSDIPEQIRPEVQSLKKFIKAKKQKERRQQQLIAQGKLAEKQQDQLKKEEVPQAEKYRVNEFGQLVDENNNFIFIKNQTTDLIINKANQQKKQARQLNKKQRIKFHDRLSRGFLDRNLVLSGAKKRIRRSMLGLQFLQQGSYQPYSGKKQETQVKDLDEIAKNETQNQGQVKIVKKRFKTRLQFSKQVPKIQWWDSQIVDEQAYLKLIEACKESKTEINFQNILNIQKLNNEVIFQQVGDTNKKQQKINMPIYLTKDQMKKLKRKRKREKLIEKNDMVKLGLIQPEKPKLKVSNMAIVMKDQFIIDPSKVQAQAKRQQEQRLNKHLNANSQRKLSKSQKKQKIIRKLKRDSAKQCRRIVFKVNRLDDPSQKFKVNRNADQLKLNGFVLAPAQYHSQPVLVMAEGGQKSIRFFKNLMLNRIKWNEKDDNRCELVWQGEIENSKLGKWKTIQAGDQSESIRALTQKGVQNFSQYLS